ncbi:PIG-L deacetylase family protein [Chloroflexota bacterium]
MAVKQAQVMVVTPHPDDAEFGVAGTVVKWVREGRNIVYVVCTSGDKGTSDINVKPEKLAKIREQEQLAAAKVLGVRDVVFLRRPDQSLEDTPEFRKEIVRLIRMYRPETVVTAGPYRRYIWHRDHRIVGRVTMDAIFPYARDHLSYPDLLEEGLQPHKVKEVFLWASQDDVNYCSDITDTFDVKMAALRCHKSQVENNFSEMEKRLRAWARQMSGNQPYELAEAFHRVEITW